MNESNTLKYYHICWDPYTTMPRFRNIEILPKMNEYYQSNVLKPFKIIKSMMGFHTWVFLFHKFYPMMLAKWVRRCKLPEWPQEAITESQFLRLVLLYTQSLIDARRMHSDTPWPITIMNALKTHSLPEPECEYFFLDNIV